MSQGRAVAKLSTVFICLQRAKCFLNLHHISVLQGKKILSINTKHCSIGQMATDSFRKTTNWQESGFKTSMGVQKFLMIPAGTPEDAVFSTFHGNELRCSFDAGSGRSATLSAGSYARRLGTGKNARRLSADTSFIYNCLAFLQHCSKQRSHPVIS